MVEEVFFHFPEKFYVDLIFEDCLSRSLVSMEIASLSFGFGWIYETKVEIVKFGFKISTLQSKRQKVKQLNGL